MPSTNEKDLRDIPDEVKEKMAFTFASTMDEVIHLMLLQPPGPVLADSQPRRSARKKAQAPAESTEHQISAEQARPDATP